jgi:hypothetical protein
MKKRRFIEYSYIGFPIVIVIALFFTFSSKNNFTADHSNQIGLVSTDTISQIDVAEFVRSELIEPFKELRVLHLEGATNDCFEHQLIFSFNYEEEAQLPFYKNQMVGARVVESDCEQKHHLYEMKIWYDDKKIEVRKSIDDEWQTVAEFLNRYKNKINR